METDNETVVTTNIAPELSSERNETHEYLWIFHTTDPNNIFVKSKTCDSTTKFSIIVGICILIPVSMWMIIFSVMMSNDYDTVSNCLWDSLFITAICIVGFPLLGAGMYWLKEFIIRTRQQVTDELNTTVVHEEGTRFEFLEIFYTTNPNNIFVKSKTCHNVTRNTICVIYTLIIGIITFFIFVFKVFSPSLMAICGSAIVACMIAFGVLFVTMLIIVLIKVIVKCQYMVHDELNEESYLFSSA